MVQSQNNLKQLGLAAMSHEQANRWLPTGGWGYVWVGDPSCGFGRSQPGGFPYNCLPYLEQQSLHDLQLGTVRGSAEQLAKALEMIQTPLAVLACPTRRRALVYPIPVTNFAAPVNCNVPPGWSSGACQVGWCKTDYAANAGSYLINIGTGPSSWASAVNSNGTLNENAFYPASTLKWTTGVCGQRSRVKMADITDGTSNTYLVGEKYLNPDAYYGQVCDGGDDQYDFGGDSVDLTRAAGSSATIAVNFAIAPLQDIPGHADGAPFGSAHAVGFNMAFCDGSVRTIPYSIDLLAHMYLSSRNDGKAIDAKKL